MIKKNILIFLLVVVLLYFISGCSGDLSASLEYKKVRKSSTSTNIITEKEPKKLEFYPLGRSDMNKKGEFKEKEKYTVNENGVEKEKWRCKIDYDFNLDTGAYAGLIIGIAEGFIPIIGAWFNKEEEVDEDYEEIPSTNTPPEITTNPGSIQGLTDIEYVINVTCADDFYLSTGPVQVDWADGSKDEVLPIGTTDYWNKDFKHTWTTPGDKNIKIKCKDREGLETEEDMLIQLNQKL